MEDFVQNRILKNEPWKWNSPPLFTEFHREADELLGYDFDGEYSVLKTATTGQALRSTIDFGLPIPISDASLDAHYKFKNAHFKAHLKTDSNSLIRADMFLHKQVGNSSLTGILVSLPHYSFTKLGLSSFKPYGAIGMVAGLNRHPDVSLQASLGTDSLALGGKLKYSRRDRFPYDRLFPLEIGIFARNPNFTATTLFDPVSKRLRSSCVHHLDKDKRSSVVLHMYREFREFSMRVGGEWVGSDGPLSSTVLKGTLAGRRSLKACVRHRVKDRNAWVVEISGLFDPSTLETHQISLSVESTLFM